MSNNALTVRDGGGSLQAPAVTEKDLELVKKIIFPDADDAELKLFLFECSAVAFIPWTGRFSRSRGTTRNQERSASRSRRALT